MELSLALIGVAGTIVGAVVGVWLGHRFAKHDALEVDERTRVRQREAILKILHAELHWNLESLKNLWETVSMNLSGSGSRFDMARSFRSNVGGLTIPSWKKELFTSQIPTLGFGLDAEEIDQYMNFYWGLAELSKLLDDLGNQYRAPVNVGIEQRDALLEATERQVKSARVKVEELTNLGTRLLPKGN